MTCDVFLALGSNLGDREKNLRESIEGISRIRQMEICRMSNIYETDPVGYIEQDRFLNMAISVRTELEPLDLLDELQRVENQLKRTREIRWGPRTCDIDILLFGSLKISLPRLVIPHPRMFERAFVLIPLKDVYPGTMIEDTDIDDIINKCGDKDAVRLYKRIEVIF